jgi:flagellar basal-body rod modification protein FlgD
VFNWNGKSTTGRLQPDGGQYTLRVTALDSAGNPVTAVDSATGVVSRVENINGQTILTIGNAKAIITNITGVTEAASTTPPTTTPPASTT